MPFDARERELYRLKVGDILACEGRHVGKSAIWRGELPEVYYQMSLHRLRSRNPALDIPEFMLYYMEHCSIVGVFSAATAPTTIPHMSAKRLASIELLFPDREHQRTIAQAIGDADLSLQAANIRLQQARALTTNIAASLFGCGR